jgi:hypothetical protein
LQSVEGQGTEYQVYVDVFSVSKITGAWERIAAFDSNLQCAGSPIVCGANNEVKNIAVAFTHPFDFENYSYSVYGRLYRALATFSLSPALYQLRLQAAQE